MQGTMQFTNGPGDQNELEQGQECADNPVKAQQWAAIAAPHAVHERHILRTSRQIMTVFVTSLPTIDIPGILRI